MWNWPIHETKRLNCIELPRKHAFGSSFALSRIRNAIDWKVHLLCDGTVCVTMTLFTIYPRNRWKLGDIYCFQSNRKPSPPLLATESAKCTYSAFGFCQWIASKWFYVRKRNTNIPTYFLLTILSMFARIVLLYTIWGTAFLIQATWTFREIALLRFQVTVITLKGIFFFERTVNSGPQHVSS